MLAMTLGRAKPARATALFRCTKSSSPSPSPLAMPRPLSTNSSGALTTALGRKPHTQDVHTGSGRRRSFAKLIDHPLGPKFPATTQQGHQQAHPQLKASTSFSLNGSFPLGPKAVFRLEEGLEFEGRSFGADTCVSGEAVFTTSLVGYPESMTDPSYCGQILVFTQPLVGNYGVPAPVVDEFGLLKHFESDRIHVKGIVVSDYATRYSHWNAVCSLGDWCKSQNIPAISGVDTRAIVHALRNHGSSPAELIVGDREIDTYAARRHHQPTFVDPNTKNLVERVSVKSPIVYNRGGDVRIALIDCGVKHNIIRRLARGDAEVVLLPWDYDYTKHMDHFDGIFVTNGPGDPRHCKKTIAHLRHAIEHFDKPIFGICMGNLLVGLAAGLGVKKLPFGNRGHNQPALNLLTGQCVITSQNHGYALVDDNMPAGWERYFVNANDGSNEGIRHMSKPISSVQFHPEARGGPRDCEPLFPDFLDAVRARAAAASTSRKIPFLSVENRDTTPSTPATI